jgi:hypothetical protein
MVMNGKEKLCQAVRKDGKQCQAKSIREGYCFAHSPELADKRKEARKLGGKNKSNMKRLAKRMPNLFTSTLEKLDKAMDEVHDGKLDPKIAIALTVLSNTIVRVWDAGEAKQRIEDLEKKFQVEEPHDPLK